jgi:hypothetical protein
MSEGDENDKEVLVNDDYQNMRKPVSKTQAKPSKMDEDAIMDVGCIVICALIGLGIGAYGGYQIAGVWCAVGFGIVGLFSGAMFFALSGGFSDR